MNKEINLAQLLPQVIEIGEQAAAFIRSHYEKVSNDQIETKDENSLVSFVDQTAEKMIVAGLSEILPSAGFITEEDTPNDEDQPYTWVIDPLDGTTNFLQGLPHFSVSIALQKDDQILIGVVIDIMQNDSYSAIRNGGAFRNGQKISVSGKSTLSEVVLATGFPYDHAARNSQIQNTLNAILQKVRAVRRFGSAALDLTYVACGRLDAYYETSLNRWDVAAGILLVKEAGGHVLNYHGEEDDLSGKQILAATPLASEGLLSIIKNEYGY